ncbi:MAG: hypothetical protein R3362_02905, partial [Rhodothermales bacterium]|nr:hypothetical protein [Rhodothermales bacterium]
MTALGLLRRLGPVDLRNVRRDPLLAWSLGFPLFLALVLRWGVPALTGWLDARYGFDLLPYYPLLVGLFLLVS